MADLIDLSDMFDDPKERAAAKARLTAHGDRLKKKTGVVAKKFRSEPFKPRGLPANVDKTPLQLVVYDRYTCVCANTWVAPRYSNDTYNRMIDTTHRAHYDSAAHTLRSRTHFEYHDHSVSVCPACLNEDRTTTDPVLARMFSIKLYQEENHTLDFDNWCYPASLFPAVAVTPPTIIKKGLEYVRSTRRHSTLHSYPRYDQIDRGFAEEYLLPRAACRVHSQEFHMVWN